MSKFICWRMATLLHELSHVLHHFYTDVFEDEEHGEDWMIRFEEAICRGELKECAKKLKSPDPACLYKRRCVWCPPNGEKYSSREEFIFPKIHEKSSFGGNCFFANLLKASLSISTDLFVVKTSISAYMALNIKQN